MSKTSVDSYLSEGCGRCERFRTPAFKVHRWTSVLEAIRAVMAASELVETMKWGAPCCTLDGKNVAMMSALEDCCVLSFFKGAAIDDEGAVLERPGPNSRYARLIKFRSLQDVLGRRPIIARLIEQAIGLERAGVVVEPGECMPSPCGEPRPDPSKGHARLADAGLRRGDTVNRRSGSIP